MKESQVIEYLDFVASRCRGVMLSFNRDENLDSNPEGCDLHKLFNERFNMVEIDINALGIPRPKLREILIEYIKKFVKRFITYPTVGFKMTSEYKLRLCRSRKFS